MDEVTIIEACLDWLTTVTELPTLIEPQPTETPEPTFRFNLTGFSGQGNDRETIKGIGVLSAYGSGPTNFLSAVAAAVRKMIPLTEQANGFTVATGKGATVTFDPLNDGGFKDNENEGKYPFLWLESYRMEISYNKAILD